jgi:serine protease
MPNEPQPSPPNLANTLLHQRHPRTVIVKFSDEISVEDPRTVEETMRRHGSWDVLISRFPRIEAHPGFPDAWTSMDRKLERARARNPRYRPPNFKSYVHVTCPVEVDPEIVVEELKHWHGVERVFISPFVIPATVDPSPNPLFTSETYLQGPPVGINAISAWQIPGGDGQGSFFVDIEGGWELNHQDLVTQSASLASGINYDLYDPIYDANGNDTGNKYQFWYYHGTAVLGTIMAVNDNRGGVGIVPNTTGAILISVFPNSSAKPQAADYAAAINQVSNYAAPGTVVLLELQLLSTSQTVTPTYLPVETDAMCFAAIQLLTNMGYIVVEAAGNGGYDLDSYQDIPGGPFYLNRTLSDQFRDSGAIMVGACFPVTLARLPGAQGTGSNFGSRIDCFAWGSSILTSDIYDHSTPLPPMPPDRTDTYGLFSGTSGASAIIAGAAVSAQGMARQVAGYPYLPAMIRAQFSQPPPQNTASASPAIDKIGVMPDLKTFADQLPLPPIVYARHYLGDAGVPDPSGRQSLWDSPDIYILNTPPTMDSQAVCGQQSGTADTHSEDFINSNGDNYIFLRARNRGQAVAEGVTGALFWAEPATLVLPAAWNPLTGTNADPGAALVSFPAIPPGNVLTASTQAFGWNSNLPASGHYCFVALLGDLSNPIPSLAELDFYNDLDHFVNWVTYNRSAAWRNFNVVELIAPSSEFMSLNFALPGVSNRASQMAFEVRSSGQLQANLYLEGPGSFLNHPGIRLSISDLKQRATGPPTPTPGTNNTVIPLPLRDSLIRFENLTFDQGARHHMTLHVENSANLHRTLGTVSVRQYYKGREVGRITWSFKAASRP